MFKMIPFIFYIFCALSANAIVLDWQGVYRIEGVQLENADLNSDRSDTSYILHHLYLKPKIVASDGIAIYSRLDLFNNGNYENSQMGQFFGNGPNTGGVTVPSTTKNDRDSNVLSNAQKSDQVVVTELYLTLKSDSGYGMLIAGRKMFHFGLGMSHNDGSGQFDHWFDSKDMIAYKMSVGNFLFTPIFAKTYEGKFNVGDDVNDYMLDLSYHNRETDIQFGILYQSRIAGGMGNDAPTTTVWGAGSNTKVDHWNGQRLSLYYERKFTESRVGFEAATDTGDTGISMGTDNISLAGFGLATEFDFSPSNSKWSYKLKAGYASGDDPNTPSKYEGFIFDRNYNVGFLLMNHVLGQYDVFRTALGRPSTAPNGGSTRSSAFADEESISNVKYLAPEFTYHWKSNLDLGLGLVWGQLDVSPVASLNVDTNLGYEVDLSLKYKPSDRIVWLNQFGAVFPGGAFSRAGTYSTEYAYGITTKAAISF